MVCGCDETLDFTAWLKEVPRFDDALAERVTRACKAWVDMHSGSLKETIAAGVPVKAPILEGYKKLGGGRVAYTRVVVYNHPPVKPVKTDASVGPVETDSPDEPIEPVEPVEPDAPAGQKE